MNMDPWDAAFASPDKALALLDKTDPWDSAYSDPKKALAILNGEPDNEQFARERMANTSLPKWATAGANEGASDVWSASLRLGMRSNPVMWAMGKVPITELPDALQKEMGLKNSPKNVGEMLDERADALNRYSDAFEKAAAETDKGYAGFAAKTARGVFRSLPPTLLAGATMGPYGAIGYGVATEANQAVTEGKDAGLTGSKLTAYVTAQGAIEGTVSAIFQKVGLGGMEKIFTKGTGTALKSGFKEGLFEVMKRTGQEIPEELITEAGHAIAKRVAGVEKETDWKNLALDTVAQTALTMGLVETPGLGRLAATEKNRQAMWDQKRAAKTDLAAEMAKPEFAQAWAAENPDLAARMAAIESPSRKDWEDITGSTSRGNPASRKAFADNVRATLGSTSATTPIANDPTPDQTAPQPVEQVTQFSTPKVDYNLKDAPTPARDPRWNYAAPTPEDLSATDGSEEGSVRRLNAIAPPAEQFAIGQADTIELDPINKLKELYPEVANLMPESAGVKEGLTIEQHTRTVLQNFQEQADPAELETLSQALGTNVQRLVEYAIALHDIGKPKAVKLGNKSRQHEFTLPILQDVMKSEGFGEEHIRIASTLVDNDVLGDVLKGRLTAKDALPKIQALAQKAGLPATTFLKLQSMLYKADASAYPAVRAKAFRPINGGQKLRTENTQFGILEEMVYGEVRDNPWIAGTQQTQRTASGQGDGGPRRSADGYVHGTAVKFDEFDANADSGRNLVGRGTYLVTDQDADVAQHYSDRAIKKMMGVFQPKYRDTILNLKPENVGPFLERGNRGARLADAAGNKPLADRFRKAVAVLELVGKGVLGKHVLPVEFSPQNTLVLGSEESGGRALTPTEKQNLEAAAGVKIDKLRAWDFFKAMRAQIGPDATTEAIRKAGYDSIQFVHAKGGYKRPYEVMVALDASAKVKGAPSPAPPPAAPEAASVPQEAATQPTISYLPADLQNAGDDEFEALVKQLGGKPPGKFPKNTYSARLRAQVEEIFAPPKPQVKPQRPPELSPVAPPPKPRNMPVQRAPVATVPSETANASNPPVTETPQPAPGVAQEAVAPPVDNRIVEERRAAVLAAFRGQATKATALPASDQHRGGYRVEFANGQFVDILHKDTIEGDREGIRRSLVGKLGREPTEEEIANHGPSAAFVVRDDEGRELPGLGAMHIALDTPSATAYRHEALHMARRNGQITVAEWRLLKEKYAPGKNDAEAEEAVASSAEAWADPTLGDRVRAFFHKLLEALGMLDAKTVEALIKTGEVFNRKANRTPAPNTVKPTRTFPRKQPAPTQATEPVTGAVGRSTTITAGEKKYPAQYRVLDLEQITPSHDFWRGTPKDNVEDGKFPAGLQPRDYNDANEKMKVRERSNAEESHYFLEDTQRADGGPPTVSKDGIVFNGNGRAMMLQMAAGEGRYGWYKNALKEKAQAFGIDPAEVESRKHPVLVRVVDVDPNSKAGAEFAAAGNTTATMSQSSLRTASSLAKLIDADLLESVPTGEESSFSDIVAGGATGKDFRAMVYKAIPAGERPRYFNTDQTLTSDGKELVRNMLLTRILPVDVVEKLNVDRKQMGNAIEKALPVLLKLSSKPILFKQFSKAVGYLADHPDARTKATLDDVFRQRGFLDDDKLTSREKMFAEFVLLKSSTPNKFRDALRQMLADLRAGRGLLAEASADTGVLMADALGVEHRKGDGGEMFQVRERPLKWEQKPYDVQSTTYGRNRADIFGQFSVSDVLDQRQDGAVGNWDVTFNGNSAPLTFATEAEAKQAADTVLKHHFPNATDVLERLLQDGRGRFLHFVGDFGRPGMLGIHKEDFAKLDAIENEEGTDALGDVVRLNVPAWLDNVLHVVRDSGEAKSLMDTIYKYPDAWENIWERLYELKQNLKHDGKAATQDAFYELVQQINADVDSGAYDTGEIPAPPMYQTRRRGRPDLANPGTTKPVRNLVDDVDEMRNKAGEPQRRSDKDVHDAVAQRLRKDYDGEKKRLLAFVKGSDFLYDEDVVIAKEIINREAQAAIASGDTTKLKEAVSIIDAYRRQGSEAGRAFRQRRDPVETPDQRVRRNLVEAVLTPPKKDQERIDKALADGNDALAQKIRDDWAKKFGEMKRKLKALGVDLDNLNEYGYDPIKAARALNTISAAKKGVWDKAYEYWRNAILSALGTHIVNPGSSIVHGARKLMIDRTVEAMLNVVIGRKEGAQLGELKYLYAGIFPGMSRGLRNAQLSFASEKQQLEQQLGKLSEYDIDTSDAAISGELGRKVRLPQRFLLAEDEFVKSMFATMDAGAQAYRIAKGEGLKGEAMQRRIEYLVNDLQSPAWSQAYDTALDISFQQKGSATGQAIKEIGILARRKIRPLHYLIPFVTTPVNIFETGLRRAPLTGDAAMAYKMYENYKAGRSPMQGMTPRIAERVLAWATVLALWGLTGDEDDEPWITGTTPPRNRGARDLARRTYPPMSINIGGQWQSYSRIEPFATSLAMTVDTINSIKAGKGVTNGMVKSLYEQMKDKTFLDGIGDLQRALEAEDIHASMREWGSSFAVSWVPNILRSTARATTDKFPERGVWGKGEERTNRTLKRMLQKTELGFGYGDHPAIDLWGREAKRGVSGLPIYGTDIPWRILSPSETRVPDIFVGDKAILNWNAQHRGEEVFPQLPDRKLTLTKGMLDDMENDAARATALTKLGGKERSMTDAEYETFMRLSGGAAKTLVEKLRINADKPTEADMKAIANAISDAREVANATMIEAILSGQASSSAETLAKELFAKQIERQADALSRAKPIKRADREKWFADRQAALQWLRAKGVSGQDVLTTYLPELRKIKTDTTRAEKRDRLKAALRGL